MKKIQTQLDSIAKNLASLVDKIEKISGQVEKDVTPAKKVTARKATARKAPAKKAVGKRTVAKRAPVRKKVTVKKALTGKATVLDKVYDVIARNRSGANIASLKEKTRLGARQLSNALYKLSKKGKIKSKSRGVYIKA